MSGYCKYCGEQAGHISHCPRGTENELEQLRARNAELERQLAEAKEEIENLNTVMMASAVEITEHWDAHCDEEGYGPVNLVRRLENGYPEKYGYDARAFVEMQKRAEQAEKRIREKQAEAKLEGKIEVLMEASAKFNHSGSSIIEERQVSVELAVWAAELRNAKE